MSNKVQKSSKRTTTSLLRPISTFNRLHQVGEGTYGKVFAAQDPDNGAIVALKRVRMENEKEGFPITALREIKILRHLQHANIVRLHQVAGGEGEPGAGKPDADGEIDDINSVFLVFEYLEFDLAGVLKRARDLRRRIFSPGHIKSLCRQLLEAVHYMHSCCVLHRDLKLANLLLSRTGYLKLADFGLARYHEKDVDKYTNRVITLWYRPPELLLGAQTYDFAVDNWSAGCILAELINGEALMTGQNEPDQLTLIYGTCGTPQGPAIAELSKLQWWGVMQPKSTKLSMLHERIRDPAAVPVCKGLLELGPSTRHTAEQALAQDYFWRDPKPIPPGDEASWASALAAVGKDGHEYTVRIARESKGAPAKRKIGM